MNKRGLVYFSLSENKAFEAAGVFVRLPICWRNGLRLRCSKARCVYLKHAWVKVCTMFYSWAFFLFLNPPPADHHPTRDRVLVDTAFSRAFIPLSFEEEGLGAHPHPTR